MQLLLDTHVLLWFAWGDAQLSRRARYLIEDGSNQVFVSVVTLWELAIKLGTGKLTFASPLEDFLREHLDGNDIVELPIARRHCIGAALLPHHHRDPFDRMLIAQSLSEEIPLVSADPALDAYGITRLW